MYKYIATIFFFISTSAGAGLFGPDSFEECKFEKGKECNTDKCIRMAIEVCKADFPYQKTSDWELFKEGKVGSPKNQISTYIDLSYGALYVKVCYAAPYSTGVCKEFVPSNDIKDTTRYITYNLAEFAIVYQDEGFLSLLAFDPFPEYTGYLWTDTTYKIYHAKRERKAKGWFD